VDLLREMPWETADLRFDRRLAMLMLLVEFMTQMGLDFAIASILGTQSA